MDFDFDDEIIIEDDINCNILCNDVLQNFPFLEDDIDAITDYELISKTYEYLDDKKANKEDIPNLDDYYTKEETNQKLDEKADISDIPDVSDFITKNVNNLTYYTKTSDLSSVATSGDYDDLINKPTIPTVPTNVSSFNNDAGYITKDVDDLTNYTKSSSLSTVATTGSYNDLSNKPTIPTVPTNVSSFNNDAGYITKAVNDLTNYTTSTALTTLLSNKEDISVLGSNANGNYLKLANGVLIQWNKIEVSDQAITGSYGSLYQGTRAITFPIAFVGDLPTVQCSEFQYGSGASWGCVVGNGTTLTGTLLRGWDAYSRDAGTNCRISWIAIGKWK